MNLVSVYLLCGVLAGFFISNEVEAEKELSEVVVVGGGMAGMAAARRLVQEGSMYVRVLEARRDRYGGRVWTNRTAVKGCRGADVELGAGLLNTRATNNPLLDLVKEFDLETKHAGSLQVHFPDQEGGMKILSGENATDLFSEAFKIAIKRLKVVKESGQDVSLKELLEEAVNDVYNSYSNDVPKYDKSLIEFVFSSFLVSSLEDFSALQYEVENDFGWDQIVVDGVGALLDRIVGGATGRDAPLKIELNKVLRHVKIDDVRKKVLIRTTDRKQIQADAVILALPIGVLKSHSVLIEPNPSPEWYKAIDSLGLGYSCKIVVGFEEAFWPKNVGTFIVFSETASEGFLQTWFNSYRLTDNPFLTANIIGNKAVEWEAKSKKEQKAIVLKVLGEMFGEETVNNHKITTFLVSNWSSDEFMLGSVSYPKVGSTPELWKTLQEPMCPYIFFAGAYTESLGHIDSLNGAYNSGIRAAEQLINHICRDKAKAKRKDKKSQAASGRDGNKSFTHPKKDEL